MFEPKPNIILGFKNDCFRGPGIVVQNLTKGLNNINQAWLSPSTGKSNKIEDFEDNTKRILLGLLQSSNFGDTDVKIDLLGPNVFVMPREAKEGIKHSKMLVVPSQWCKEKYLAYDSDIIGERKIYVWPVGIDTVDFAPNISKPKPKSVEEMKVLVYYKNRSADELEEVLKLLSNFGIKMDNINILRYGLFTKEELKDSCNKADFCVLLTHTESQGIATLEILSMGVPMIVFNQKLWTYLEDPTVIWKNATSVPYFDDRCGMIANDFVDFSFGKFLTYVLEGQYSPRDYIVENFTLEQRAREYVEIISKSNKFY